MIDRGRIHHILVIKLRAIGDVVLSTIVTKNLRLAFPDARIDFLTEPPGRHVLDSNPFVDTVMVYDKRKMSGLNLIRRVRKERYDLVIDLFGNPRTALVTFASGARDRVGYRFRGRQYAYSLLVEPRGGKVHNTQFNLDALEALGIAIQDRNLYFNYSPADLQYVDSFLEQASLNGRLLMGINAGGGWYTKRWGLEKFAALADRLIDTYGCSILLIWGPGQLPDVEQMKAQMRHPAIIPPPTTLPQLGALLSRLSCVVSNDSGPMHIAAAVGTPVLGIYGPTNPLLQGPYGEKHLTVSNQSLDCLGCNFTRCPIGNPCMLDLSVDTVFAAATELVKKNLIA